MSYKIMEEGHKPNTIWRTYICDTNDDVGNLPTDAPVGSRALVAKNGDLYLLDSQGIWNPMPRGGGGGGGGGSEIFDAIFSETTYQEIDEAYGNGKLILLKDANGLNYIAGIPLNNSNEYVFHVIDKTGTTNMYIVDSDGWSIESISEIFYAVFNATTFEEIQEMYNAGRFCVLTDKYEGAVLINYDGMEGFEFAKPSKTGIFDIWCSPQNQWSNSLIPFGGIYYVDPDITPFMTIIDELTHNVQPIINDTVNGRAYYISNYTIVDGQPAAITFSTIGASDPHTWTVDYQDNWTST